MGMPVVASLINGHRYAAVAYCTIPEQVASSSSGALITVVREGIDHRIVYRDVLQYSWQLWSSWLF